MSLSNMLSRGFRKVFLRGGSPYYYCRKYLEIAATLPELTKRKKLAAKHRQRADSVDVALVRTLQDHGYVVLAEPLEFTREVVAECNRRLSAHQAASASGSASVNPASKFFWHSLLADEDLTGDSVFVRYALQEKLVRWASMYLGETPYLSDVSVQYSFEVKGTTPTHSQLWHKDFDDIRMFKVFVYCSDVLDEDDGPLQVADRRALRSRFANPLFSTRRYDDERFFAMIDPRLVRAICGPAGTTFICDTQKAFHCGSRCHRPRLACWFTYQSYAGLFPVRRRTTIPSASPFAYVLSDRIATAKDANSH